MKPKSIDDISAMLLRGEEVSFPKVGKLKVVIAAARKARNPITGAEVDVPEQKKVKFVPSSTLKEQLNPK